MKNQIKKPSKNRRAPSSEEKLAIAKVIAQRYRGALAKLANPDIALTLSAQKKVLTKYKSTFKRLAKS
jgi:hypothetical protein